MIKATALIKKFDDFTALDNISCNIPDGCIYGLVGSNGAGKSTFLRLIAGIYKADGGNITIDDKEVFENPDAKKRIAFIPDDLFFLSGSTMERMASLYAAVYPNFDTVRFSSLSDAFNLDTKKSLNTFSKGMRRQAATILAISSKPDYLLMDETFDGLDPVMRNLVKGLICSDVVERKATAILSSHSLRELEDTCDQLALLHKGGLVFESDIVNLKTTLFKIQTAFNYDYDKSLFTGIDMLHFSKYGSVSNIIVRGNKDVTISRLKSLNPIILDILPLTLEEVFTYEMEALGYTFQDVLEVK